MNKMPEEIKNVLREYAEVQKKSFELNEKLQHIFDSYGVPYENLIACGQHGEVQTEALAFINNCEFGSAEELESTINEIEEVFLHFVSKERKVEMYKGYE